MDLGPEAAQDADPLAVQVAGSAAPARQPSPATASARRSVAVSRAITPGTPLTKPIGNMPVLSKRP